MLKLRQYIMYLLIVLALGSCSKYQTLVKKGTPEEKYNAALKYYAKDDFYHAQQLFDELIILYRGTSKLERLYYYYAQTYYKQSDFIVASYHFKYFAKTFPNSEYAEECYYLSAYCKYLDSAPDNLDQSSTKAAVTDMQMFINTYPDSPKVEEANKVMDELRAKLVVKDFENAKQYLTTQYYKSAIYALKQHAKDYPSSPYADDAMYLIIKANYEYAYKSVFVKQKERFTITIAAYNDYFEKYPEGDNAKLALKLLHSSQEQIKKVDRILNKKIR